MKGNNMNKQTVLCSNLLEDLRLSGLCLRLLSETPVEEIDKTSFKTACLNIFFPQEKHAN